MENGWRSRAAAPTDFGRWRELYSDYAAFYGVEQTEANVQTVWNWLLDPAHELRALLVEDGEGRVVGLAHYRPFSRPLHGSTGCFLDDLYVDQLERGKGAVECLVAAVVAIAQKNSWSVIRWITADDNYRARAKYDQVASRTSWVTYDLHV